MSRRERIAAPVPTVWCAALMALGGLVLLAWPGRSWMALVVVEALIVAACTADLVLCGSPRAIGVERELPTTMRVGEVADGGWVIENRTGNHCAVTVTDALWPSLGASRRSVHVELAPSSRVRARATLAPTRRGRFPLDDVTVRVGGPLHLVGRQSSRSLPGGVRVMPAYPSRDDVRRRMRTPRVPDAGQRSIRTAGGGTEFDQLREYRPDDEFRRIDWAGTMRLQRPIVKQFRTERNQTVVILLDNGRVMAGNVGSVARVEHAMDAALGLADAAVFMADRVGLVCFDRQVRSIVPAVGSRRHLGHIAEAMYVLEPDLAESAYTTAFGTAAARFRRRSLYVVLTDLAEATVEQAVLPALSILVRTHLVVVASVRDPVVSAWACGGAVEWPSEVFRQAAAITAGESRDRAAARLRAAGAIVVDADPGELAIRLVDTYLDLKSSGRL